MAIEFMNIKTGERRVLKDPHQIGAFINSSDMHVNSNLGQDFGWRLAPSVIARIDEMRLDAEKLERVSRRIGVEVSDLTNIHLVNQISYEEDVAAQSSSMRKDREPEFKAEYEAELERLRNHREDSPEPEQKPKASKPADK